MTKEQIMEFIKGQKIAYVSSVGEDGYPSTEALSSPLLIDDNDLYFVADASSSKISNFKANPKTCVCFIEKEYAFINVEIKGNMKVISNQDLKNKFWKPEFRNFFMEGPTDQDYCILRFTGSGISYSYNKETNPIIV